VTDSDHLLSLLNFNGFTSVRNLDGVTDKISRQEVIGEVNTIHWLLGHLIATRQSLLDLLGAPRHWSADECADFGAKGWEELTAAWAESQERLAQAIREFTRWMDVVPTESPDHGEDYGKQVGFFLLHESYHLGQIGALRRAHGLPGQIG